MSVQTVLSGLMNVVMSENIGSYQGDWIAVVTEDNDCWETVRGGFLVNAYGSCSHCDSWLAATSVLDRLNIIERLVGSIRWFAKPSELVEWLKSEAPQREWFGHEPQWREFVRRVEQTAASGADEWIDFAWNSPSEVRA